MLHKLVRSRVFRKANKLMNYYYSVPPSHDTIIAAPVSSRHHGAI